MNANQLYTGEYYAYDPNRRRGYFSEDAYKCRVILVERIREEHRENVTSIVEIEVVDERWPDYRPRKRQVSTRSLIDFWDDYIAEVNRLQEERAKAARERVERQARERERAEENRKKVEEKLQLVRDALVVNGFRNQRINLSWPTHFADRPELGTVQIPLDELARWLGVDLTDSEPQESESALEFIRRRQPNG